MIKEKKRTKLQEDKVQNKKKSLSTREGIHKKKSPKLEQH